MSKDDRAVDSSTLGKVLTFFSTSSAVGKSVAAVNSAAYLAKNGYTVCLVDFDLQFGDIARYLDLSPDKTIYDYAEEAEASETAVDYTLPTDFGFDVLACPNEIDEAWVVSPEAATRAINQLRSAYDYILVDTATGFSTLNTSILEQTDTLYLLFVVDFIPSIKDLKVGLETLANLSYDRSRLRLILNRSNAQTQISVKDVEGILGRPFDYVVSNDYAAFIESLREARPALLSEKKSKAADEMVAMLAEEFGEDAASESGIKGWLGKLWKK